MRLSTPLPVLLLATGCLILGCANEAQEPREPAPELHDSTATTDAQPATTAIADERRIEFSSYTQVVELFEELNYTPEAWQAGVREVPRVYITEITDRWRNETTKEITVQLKKRLFFRALAPLVLRGNEMIAADRSRAEPLVAARRGGESLAAEDAAWLHQLALRYDVIDDEADSLATDDLAELLARVDIVPVSLALSQGAEESGWGTSRFAAEGNALFGQWTWGEHAIKPEQHREKLGSYGIRAFESPLQSVLAYMHNLNTHRAYTDLRARRAELRAAGEPLSGRVLAETLTSYSERGVEYVKSLHAIMRVNHLDPTDSAYLGDGPAIYLVPVSA